MNITTLLWCYLLSTLLHYEVLPFVKWSIIINISHIYDSCHLHFVNTGSYWLTYGSCISKMPKQTIIALATWNDICLCQSCKSFALFNCIYNTWTRHLCMSLAHVYICMPLEHSHMYILLALKYLYLLLSCLQSLVNVVSTQQLVYVIYTQALVYTNEHIF